MRYNISLLPLSAKRETVSLCDPSFPHDKTDFVRQKSAGCSCKVVAAFGFTPAHRRIILWMNAVEITHLKFYASDKCHLICFVNQHTVKGPGLGAKKDINKSLKAYFQCILFFQR